MGREPTSKGYEENKVSDALFWPLCSIYVCAHTPLKTKQANEKKPTTVGSEPGGVPYVVREIQCGEGVVHWVLPSHGGLWEALSLLRAPQGPGGPGGWIRKRQSRAGVGGPLARACGAGGNFRGVLGRGSPLVVMTKLHLLAHFHLSLSEYSSSPNPQDLAAIWKFSKWVMTSF